MVIIRPVKPTAYIQDQGTRGLFTNEAAAALLVSDYLVAVIRGERIDVALWAVANFPYWQQTPGVRAWIRAEMETWGELLRDGMPVRQEFGSMLALHLAMNYRTCNLSKRHKRNSVARFRHDLTEWAGRIARQDYGVLNSTSARALVTGETKVMYSAPGLTA